MNNSSKFKVQSSKLLSGFTLIELLVVVAILGILSALILSNMNGARERARDAQRKSDLNQIKTAIRMYAIDNTNKFPTTATVVFGSALTNALGTMTYMNLVPDDPSHGTSSAPQYSYTAVGADLSDFCMFAGLENLSDQEALKSHTRCVVPCTSITLANNDYVVCAD